MKIRWFIVLLPLVLFLCCNQDTRNRIDSISKSNSHTSDIDKNVIKKAKGIYLPTIYINELAKVKSHIQSSGILNGNKATIHNAIIVSDTDFLCIENFHEGGGGSIVYAKKNIIKLDSYSNEIYELVNENTLVCNGISYTKISNRIKNYEKEISAYVTNVIFSKNKYYAKNGESIYRLSDGRIYYQGNKYNFCLGLIFTSIKYDEIECNDYKLRHNICISGNQCFLYKAIIPDTLQDDPFGIMYAEYYNEEIFELKK